MVTSDSLIMYRSESHVELFQFLFVNQLYPSINIPCEEIEYSIKMYENNNCIFFVPTVSKNRLHVTQQFLVTLCMLVVRKKGQRT